MVFDEPAKSVRSYQGYVARKDEEQRFGILKHVPRCFDRISGSALLSLSGKLHGRSDVRRNDGFDFIALVPDHHDDRFWIKRPGGAANVNYQGKSTKFVQDLGTARFHSRSQAGSQYQDIQHFSGFVTQGASY
jgi:hypothetical protein